MNSQRRKEVHYEGADTTAELEPIPDIALIRADLAGNHPAYSIHVLRRPGSRAEVRRPVVYFAGDKMESTAKCAQYLRLLEKLVQEFIRERP